MWIAYGPVRLPGRRNWYALLVDETTRRHTYRSLHTPSKRAARYLLERLRVDQARNALRETEGGCVRVAESLRAWQSSLELRCAEITRRNIGSAVRRWLDRWGNWEMRALTRDVIQGYLIERSQSVIASTLNLERKHLRWWFRWAREAGQIAHDLLAGIPASREPRHAIRVLTDEELETMLRLATPLFRALITLAVETGLRRRSLLELRWEWFNFDTGWVEVPAESIKGFGDYRAPLSHLALETLRSIRDKIEGRVFPWAAGTVSHIWHDIAVKAGLRGAPFHTLRKTFLTRCRQRGVPIEIAMALSDHRDFAVVMKHYRAVEEEELLKAVRRDEESQQKKIK